MKVTYDADVEISVDGTLVFVKAGDPFEVPDEEARAYVKAGIYKASKSDKSDTKEG